ncbi:MAG: DinB family protein [Pyrinomonadaceae bacterium]
MEISELFIKKSRAYLSETYLPKLEKALADLPDEDIWWRANEASNSIGNLLLHLDGSTRMWVISGVGGAPDHRDRQQEFDERDLLPGTELLAQLKATLSEVDQVLAAVTEEQLASTIQVRDNQLTALAAIYHAVEHFSMHTGQILMLAKMRKGRDLELSK